jgi:uncharacterized pyridoxamine 5'-phosphate oxidase family protein
MTYTKTFQFKGQMINYYNKVKNNPNIAFCTMYTDVRTGFTIMYTYKK